MANPTVELSRVPFDGVELLFEAGNDMVAWRAQSAFTKEPDTVAWIRQFRPGEVLVDVGANVGIYSIMAAKGRGVRVFAFEPESQNFALLNRNIVYNEVHDRCIAFPIALSDACRVDRLHLSRFSAGGSCHTFGANLDFHLRQRPPGYAQGAVSMTLDKLVADGVVPQPDHLKIDVDGLEHLVLEGASNVLACAQLKSVLVELNGRLPEHRAIIERMQALGYRFQQVQVDVAVRREGAFEGVGNHVFFRPQSGIGFDALADARRGAPGDHEAAKAHVLARLGAARIESQPYPHVCLDRLFPEDFYRLMMEMKPEDEELVRIDETGRAKGYPERSVLHLAEHLDHLRDARKREFWRRLDEWLCGPEVLVAFVRLFGEALVAQGRQHLDVRAEAMLMRDYEGYRIGPHTDSAKRLLTMMVYLPGDDAHGPLGTTVYAPSDPAALPEDSAHHDFSKFQAVATAPYLPNTAFAFLRGDRSFHGVAPMLEDYRRDTMAYILRHRNMT